MMNCLYMLVAILSHPTGVRGLKYRSGYVVDKLFGSHPTGVRGLKFTTDKFLIDIPVMSHPTGVRGLKLEWGRFHG